jgi:dTDP-3-amino-3,4,6-trideoxy-alpha-D-glucose transaminase
MVTNIGFFAKKVQMLREYGYGERFVSNVVGINSRLDEIQAAVLRVRLRYLEEENDRRRFLAGYYRGALDVTMPPEDGVFHQFVIRTPKRDELVKLGYQIHYPVPCHKQPAYKNYDTLPVTERIVKEIVSLPMRVTLDQAEEEVKKIKEIL